MANNKNPWEDETPTKDEKFTKFSDLKKDSDGSFAPKIKLLIFAAVAAWMSSGFYQVEPNEQGVVTRFGAYKDTTESGLHYHLPFPIEAVMKVDQTRERSFTLGSGSRSRGNEFSDSHMLTGDESIVNIELNVVWKVKNAKDYLFSLREPDQTIEVAAQSVLREIVGQSEMQAIMTGDRGKLEDDTKKELQSLMDEFKSGIIIVRVQLQNAAPPREIEDAFNEVQRARSDRERLQLDATSYSNNILPKAEGEAISMLNQAEAYRQRVINEASGEAERYQSVYNAYKQGKDVTSTRMYLETMENVLSNAKKIIIDPSSKGSNALPILNLNK